MPIVRPPGLDVLRGAWIPPVPTPCTVADDPQPWFTAVGDDAAALCRGCPLTGDCLREARERGETAGVRGGIRLDAACAVCGHTLETQARFCSPECARAGSGPADGVRAKKCPCGATFARGRESAARWARHQFCSPSCSSTYKAAAGR